MRMPNPPMLAIIEATFRILADLLSDFRKPNSQLPGFPVLGPRPFMAHTVFVPSAVDKIGELAPRKNSPPPLVGVVWVGVSVNAEFDLWGVNLARRPTWVGSG
jgi:hypothetical protein